MQALILKMRALCLIRVSRDGRQTGNQMNRLPQHVVQGGILCFFIETIHGEDAPRHLVHDARRGIGHDHISRKSGRQFSQPAQKCRVVF